MKKWIKRIIWLIVIAAIVYGGYFWSQKNKQPAEEYVTEELKLGTLVQTVEATGSVESAKELELNFKISGRVQKMNVGEGETVRAGQTLAGLEAGDLMSRVTDARGQLQAAEAELDRVLAGSSSEDIDVSQKTVEQREQALQAAKNSLASLKAKKEVELQNYRDTAWVYLDSEIVAAELAIKKGEDVFENNDAEGTLGVLDSLKVAETLEDIGLVKKNLTKSQEKVGSLVENASDKDVRLALDSLKQTLESVGQFLTNVYGVLEATLTSSRLSESDLDALKSTIQSEYAKVAVSKTNIQTAKSNWINKEIYYDDLIVQAEDSIAAAERALGLAKSQLGLKQAGPRSFEIAAAEAKVKQAQASLGLAQANLSNAAINAPVDGVVTKIENKVGEQTSLVQPVIRMVGLSNYEIEVDVPESDIAKVAAGQRVEITLDAFRDDQAFRGVVAFIEPAETVIQDVVYYKVRVEFDEYDQSIKPGMTANLTIETNHKDNVLLIPLRAVKASNGRRFVEVVDSMGVKKEKDIKLGLRGDNGYEVLSGLEEGDEVVVYVKKNK